MSINMKIQEDSQSLREELKILSQELREITNTQEDNISPSWIAHTSNKINSLERNISKI